MATTRRVVIIVCPREPGAVTLPVTRGGRTQRLNASAIAGRLETLVATRDLAGRVSVREACAGGCTGPGPNVSVTIYPVPRPGERADHVAIGWRTYVYSLGKLDALERVITDNLGRFRAPASPAQSGPGGRDRKGGEAPLRVIASPSA